MSISTLAPRMRDGLARLDPGRIAWRRTVAATISLGAALGTGYGYSVLVAPALGAALPMISSGVMAMQASAALVHPLWRARLRVAVLAPIFFGSGLLVHIAAAGGGAAAEIATFAVVTFVTVGVRRFGPDFGVLGLVGWTGCFIGAFADPSPAEAVQLLGALGAAALVTFAVSLPFWPHRPQSALAHALRAWRAQTDAVLTAADAVRRQTTTARRRRATERMIDRNRRLTELSLLAEGWLGHDRASSTAATPHSIRRRLLRMQITLDTVVRTVGSAVDHPGGPHAHAVDTVVCALARNDADLAITYSHRILDAGGSAEAAAFAADAIELATLRRDDTVPETSPLDTFLAFVPAAATAPDGSLAGSAITAPKVIPRGNTRIGSWHLATRQAIQATIAVAVATGIGFFLSAEHYTWAALTAFIIFLGTSTRGDVAVKALHRGIGTVAGTILAVPIVLVAGTNPAVVIGVTLLCCAIGYYTMSISYVYLMLCISVAVSELYNILGQFDSTLTTIRIAETVLGASVAVLVAALVVPLSTTDSATHARQQLFRAVHHLLSATADHLRDEQHPEGHHEVLRHARVVDECTRQLTTVAAPLRMLRIGRTASGGHAAFHRYDEYSVHTRGVVASLREQPTDLDDRTYRYCREVALLAQAVAEQADDAPEPAHRVVPIATWPGPYRLHESLGALAERLNTEMKTKKVG